MFSIELGYGYAETELDQAVTSDELSAFYAQTTVTLAPGVFFVPEVGFIDAEEDGQGETLYFGAKWQINF